MHARLSIIVNALQQQSNMRVDLHFNMHIEMPYDLYTNMHFKMHSENILVNTALESYMKKVCWVL